MNKKLYKDVKIILMSKQTCKSMHNKFVKILVNSNDTRLNNLITSINQILVKGRIWLHDNEEFVSLKEEIRIHCEDMLEGKEIDSDSNVNNVEIKTEIVSVKRVRCNYCEGVVLLASKTIYNTFICEKCMKNYFIISD
jgi:hypothetical protein